MPDTFYETSCYNRVYAYKYMYMYLYLNNQCILSVLFNPLTAKLFNMNFHPLEIVSRWRDPQLQVGENYSDLTKWRSTVFKIADWCHILSLTCLKGGTVCANNKWKAEYMRHWRLKGWKSFVEHHSILTPFIPFKPNSTTSCLRQVQCWMKKCIAHPIYMKIFYIYENIRQCWEKSLLFYI